jgi:hypothetical protein
MMYRNPQIHAESEHYPKHKWAICLIVIRHVSSICDTDGTDEEVRYPNQTFRENSCSNQDIRHNLHPKIKLQTQDGKPTRFLSLLPYQNSTFDRIIN